MEPREPRTDQTEALAQVLAPRLRMLSAIAHTEHITQAAQDLRTPQPTLSRALARIQSELGMDLVERTGRGIRLTRTGRLLLPHVERALEDLRRGMAELNGTEQGRVGLSFLPTLGVEVVPALLGGFRAHHPGIRFSLTQEAWAPSLQRLSTGGADLALTSPLPSTRSLTATTLHTQTLHLVLPQHHRLARGRAPLGVAAASGEEFILLKPDRGIRHLTDRLTQQARFTPRVAFEADDIATARGLVAAGLGVSVLPPRPQGPLPGTVEIALRDPEARRPIALVQPASPSGYQPPAVVLFSDYVRRTAPRLIPELSG